MSYRLRFSDQARDDLSSIGSYIKDESGSAHVADGFVDKLVSRCEHLAALPGTLGRGRPELRPDLRSAAFKGYVIFFRYEEEVLEVVTILEGHRDIDKLFADDDA